LQKNWSRRCREQRVQGQRDREKKLTFSTFSGSRRKRKKVSRSGVVKARRLFRGKNGREGKERTLGVRRWEKRAGRMRNR